MGLSQYKKKRNFRMTPEPAGKVERRGQALSFVIQKHDATRLHYDFRLKLDGVLKSWAVPKGPSLDPAVKSLAVEVEDHPVAYATFEGIIPEGQYGGGTVLVWDRGTWEPEGDDPAAALKKGHLSFTLYGEKLKGAWSLVRLRQDSSSKNNWLLIKKDDSWAKEGDGHGITERKPNSVVTKRGLAAVAKESDRVWTKQGEAKASSRKKPAAQLARKKKGIKKSATRSRAPRANSTSRRTAVPARQKAAFDDADLKSLEGAVRGRLPHRLKPELCVLASEVPTGAHWLHEIKFDGYRILAEVENGEVRLFTRKGLDWTHRFPETNAEIASLPLQSAILDGELVAMNDRGLPSFQRLQNALREEKTSELVYYIFDVAYLNGFDLRKVPLLQRKEVLARILLASAPANDGLIRYSDHIQGDGESMLRQMCQSSLEGVVCKDANSPYESRRSRNWIKVKCHGRQEFVIAGFTKPEGTRTGFGALALAYYDNGKLRYAGRVGTGFDQALLKSIKQKLDPLVIPQSPFVQPLGAAERRGLTYVKPKLVAEIEFTEWTDDGRLRHPVFQGLREDKSAQDVVRERAEIRATEGKDTSMKKSVTRKASGSIRSSKKPAHPTAIDDPTVAGVTLTHPDRVLFPDVGVTKLELARYYEAIADWILPQVVDRPITLVRCPDGSTGQCFYQKHWTDSLPQGIGFTTIKEKSGSDKYVVIQDLSGLIGLVQMSVLEIHPWGARADNIEKPDRIVIDLDPGPGVAWKSIVQAAVDVRDILSELKLDRFLRTSGGKGLHVVVPLARRNSWDDVEQFARNIALGLAANDPDRFVANMRNSLRQGRIYVDYLRNQRGSTAIASYSTRARPGCPVAMPVDWKRVKSLSGADEFTLRNAVQHIAKRRDDPWKDFDSARQSLTSKIRSRMAAFAKSASR